MAESEDPISSISQTLEPGTLESPPDVREDSQHATQNGRLNFNSIAEYDDRSAPWSARQHSPYFSTRTTPSYRDIPSTETDDSGYYSSAVLTLQPQPRQGHPFAQVQVPPDPVIETMRQGHPTYHKCPKCKDISKSLSDFKKHMLKHDKPHVCDVPGCRRAAAGKGFTTINDLQRHKKSTHRIGVEKDSYQCASEHCRNRGKIWPRLDNFKQHISRMHKGEDEQDLIRRSACKEPYKEPYPQTYPQTYPPRAGSSLPEIGTEKTFGGYGLTKTGDDFGRAFSAASVASDSGYRSGFGTDTASVCSTDSMASSLGLPQDFLYEFISFFGDTLIDQAGARHWAGYALELHSLEDIEDCLDDLLKEYTLGLATQVPNAWDSSASLSIQAAQTATPSQVLAGATKLIRRYRPRIAQYFFDNAASVPAGLNTFPLPLQQLGQQLSLYERLSLFRRCESDMEDPTETGLDLEAEDETIIASINPARDFLVSNEAFRRLALDLRRNLYYDGTLELDRVRTTLMKGRQAPLHEACFLVKWGLLESMTSRFGETLPRIGQVVVLSGSALYAQATTCEQYVAKVWPRTGSFFLELLDAILHEAITTSNVRVSKACNHLPLHVNVEVESAEYYTFMIRGDEEALIVELAQQLAWVGSALSMSPPDGSAAYGVSSHQRTEYPGVFKITFGHKPLHATESICWLSLFHEATIAYGFPISDRSDELGLEIPLELLAGVAGACHAVDYEGGIVMKGFSHMFVPVRKKNDCIQWHAISSNDPTTRLSYNEALSRCECRALLSEVSFEDIHNCRAILGWCSVATSTLGSDLATYDVDYSGARDAPSTMRLSEGSFGVQQYLVAALNVKFAVKDSRFHAERNGPYPKILSFADKTYITLYDTGDRRAWLVPATDVMFHVFRHRQKKDRFGADGQRVKLTADPSSGTLVKDILLTNGSLNLFDADDHHRAYTVEDEIRGIWSLLEILLDKTISREQAPGLPIKLPFQGSLCGFEFNAIVEEDSPLSWKNTKLGNTTGGWPLLVRELNSVVLLANGFGDVILPAADLNTDLCRSWQRAPLGQDYLTTTTKILNELYRMAGCPSDQRYLTSNHLQWDQGKSTLFDACMNVKAADCRCNRLQQIVHKYGCIRSPEHIVEGGAVIFGYSKSTWQDLMMKPCTQAHKVSGIYSQPNISLKPTIIQSDAEDPTSSDVEAFGQSGSEATTDSAPSSLSTCTTLPIHYTFSEAHERLHNTKTVHSSRKRAHFQEESTGLLGGEEHALPSDGTRKRPKSAHTDGTCPRAPADCDRATLVPSLRGQCAPLDRSIYGTNGSSKSGEDLPEDDHNSVSGSLDFQKDADDDNHRDYDGAKSRVSEYSSAVCAISQSHPLRRQKGFSWEKCAAAGEAPESV